VILFQPWKSAARSVRNVGTDQQVGQCFLGLSRPDDRGDSRASERRLSRRADPEDHGEQPGGGAVC
jgi:hypothetical protein